MYRILLGFFSALALVSLASPALAQNNVRVVGRASDAIDRPVLATTEGKFETAPGPSSSATVAIVPATGSLVNAVVGKAAAGNLYGGEITTGATAGFLLVFNATAAPADGAVTAGAASGNYQFCRAVAASTTLSFTFDIPDRYANGITAVFSTTGCGTLTKSATALFIKLRAM